MISPDKEAANIAARRIEHTASLLRENAAPPEVTYLVHHLLGSCHDEKETAQLRVNPIEIPAGFEERISKVVENSGIDKEREKQKCLIESLKLAAKENGFEVAENIQSYGVDGSTEEGQKGLIEIAKIAASQYPYKVTEKIQHFVPNRESEVAQKGLIEIAKIVAQLDGGFIAENIQKFGINKDTEEGQKGLIEIAEVAASFQCRALAKNIQNFGINEKTEEGQRALIAIAKKAARSGQNGGAVSFYIQNFGINKETKAGQRGLIKIARNAAQKNGFAISKNIQNFGINKELEQAALIEIAKIAAAQNGFAVSDNIQNFGINEKTEEGQRALIEIAKIAAAKDGKALSENIQKFRINEKTKEGQRALIQIAKIVAANDGYAISDNIQKFGINEGTEKGQKSLIEIAKIVARVNGGAILRYINNFGINNKTEEDKKVLIEIFKIAASKSDSLDEEYFRSFSLDKDTPENQKILIEIAKFVAYESGFRLSKNIQIYGIDSSIEEGKQALIEIAKIAASEDGGALSENIQNFGIDATSEEGQRALIEIAKIAATENYLETSKNIQNYKIDSETEEGQKGLIEIALIIAENSAYSISEYIQRFGIKDETAEGQRGLIEIAKAAANQSPFVTSSNIKNFGIHTNTIEGQRGLIEIAKIAASVKGKPTIRYLKNYGIDDTTEEGQRGLIEIKRLAVRSDWSAFNELYEHIDSSALKLELACYALASVLKEAVNGEKLPLHNSPCYGILQVLSLEKNSDLRDASQENLKNFIREVEKLVCQRWSNSKSIPIFLKQIADLKKPVKMNLQEHRVIQLQQLSFVLKAIADCFNLDEKVFEHSYCPSIAASLRLRDPKMREDIWHLLFKNNLSFRPASKTPSHAVLPSLLLHYLKMDDKEVSAHIQSLRDTSKNIIFKDADFNKLLLKTLLELYEETALSTTQKNKLLKRALSFKAEGKAGDKVRIYKALQLVKGVITFGAGEKLDASLEEEDFIGALNQIYLEAFSQVVPIRADIVDFSEKFEALQSQFRMPNALLVYASNLKKLKKNDKEIVLKSLASCLEDVLEGTFEKKRYLESLHLEAAFEGRRELKEEWIKGEKLQLSPLLGKESNGSGADFGKQLLIFFKDGHISENTYPELYLFLQTQEPSIQIRLNEQLKKAASEQEEKPILLQMKLIELAQAKGNEKELLKEILDHYLPKSNRQFQADIDGLYRSILEKEKKNNYADWVIEDTDHFEDLFLSGTEVEGSCQNINGDSNYNKCLLGYVLDGKNRLLAIKDSSGKIRARAILRLLLKGNEPALLIERIYPKVLAGELEAALENFALHRSERLKLDLLSKEVGKSKSDALETLESLGGKAPYEYVDSQNGIHKEGRFSIKEAYFIHKKELG